MGAILAYLFRFFGLVLAILALVLAIFGDVWPILGPVGPIIHCPGIEKSLKIILEIIPSFFVELVPRST